jgi:hypothetical protein
MREVRQFDHGDARQSDKICEDPCGFSHSGRRGLNLLHERGPLCEQNIKFSQTFLLEGEANVA